MAGAATAAGALAASPGAYRRLRRMVTPGGDQLLEPSPQAPALEETADQLWPAEVPAQAVADEEPAGYEPAPFELPGEDDTQELRLRIDQTRARVRERAVAERGGRPEGDLEDAVSEDLEQEQGGEDDGGGEAGQEEAPPPVEEWPND